MVSPLIKGSKIKIAKIQLRGQHNITVLSQQRKRESPHMGFRSGIRNESEEESKRAPMFKVRNNQSSRERSDSFHASRGGAAASRSSISGTAGKFRRKVTFGVSSKQKNKQNQVF